MYDHVAFAFLLSAIVGASVATWLLVRNDPNRPGFAFGLFMLVMAFWSVTHVGTLSSTTLRWVLLFTQLSYLSVVFTPITWLAFVLSYTGRGDWLSIRRIVVLSTVPVVTLVFVFTTPRHSLFYASVTLVETGGHQVLVTTPGPWHVVNVAYSYTLLAIATGVLVRSALTTNRLYRRQSAVLIACAIAPWLVNALYHIGVRPIPASDPTPLVFTLVGVPLGVVVLRTDLAAFVPVAHERVFRTLDDPVLVVRPDGRILDTNDRARSILGDGRPLEGASASEVLPEDLLEDGTLRSTFDGVVCSIPIDGERHRYLARRRDVAPARETESPGTIVSLTDVTVQMNQHDALERKHGALRTQTEKLEAKNEQLERLASIVSHDLTTPLATGESLLHLVRADLDDPEPELEQSLDDLETVHERLREFSEALPRLARESTDVDSPTECDLRTVAEAAWDVVATGELTLVVESTCTISGDPHRLQQAFENLFQNAVEHGSTVSRSSPPGRSADPDTPGGTPSALGFTGTRSNAPSGGASSRTDVTTVRVGTLDPEADSSGFYVEDDGRGIPVNQRKHLLEFGVGTGSGAGYGLAIVRTVVEAHGWSLEVTGSADGGARFEVLGPG